MAVDVKKFNEIKMQASLKIRIIMVKIASEMPVPHSLGK